jgi:ribonuclease HI
LHGRLPTGHPDHPGDPRGDLGDHGTAHLSDQDRPTLGLLDGPGAEARHPGFVIRTDGAARGNPGPASLGAVLISLDRADAGDPAARPDATISEYLGVRTNNVAEYLGVSRALALAGELGASRVELLLDSNLIVEQLYGRWRVKDEKLRPLWADCLRMLRSFPGGWTAAHVRRAQNAAADRLANEAIDRVQAGGPPAVVRRPGDVRGS